MAEEKLHCLVCEQTSDQIPLLSITYQGKIYAICPQHLPILIHHPDQLVGRLPGAEKLTPHEHDD